MLTGAGSILTTVADWIDSWVNVLTTTRTVTDLTRTAFFVRILIVRSRHTESCAVTVLTGTTTLGVRREVTRSLDTGTAAVTAALALFVRVEPILDDCANTAGNAGFVDVTCATCALTCLVTADAVFLVTATARALIVNGADITVGELRHTFRTVTPVSRLAITVYGTLDFTEAVSITVITIARGLWVGIDRPVFTRSRCSEVERIMAVATSAGTSRATARIVHTEVAIALVGTGIRTVSTTALTVGLLWLTATRFTFDRVNREVTEVTLEAVTVVLASKVTLGIVASVTLTEDVVRILTVTDTVAFVSWVSESVRTGLSHTLGTVYIETACSRTVTGTVFSTRSDCLRWTVVLRVGSNIGRNTEVPLSTT